MKGLKRWQEARAAAAVKAQVKKRPVGECLRLRRRKPFPGACSCQERAYCFSLQSDYIGRLWRRYRRPTPLKLLISVNQTVLVKVKTDGNLLFSRVLTRGSVESFTAKDRINIYVAKGRGGRAFFEREEPRLSRQGPCQRHRDHEKRAQDKVVYPRSA